MLLLKPKKKKKRTNAKNDFRTKTFSKTKLENDEFKNFTDAETKVALFDSKNSEKFGAISLVFGTLQFNRIIILLRLENGKKRFKLLQESQ